MGKESNNFPWSWIIILYERKQAEHHIDPLEFEAHKQEWEKKNPSLVFAQR
jgi:hypothetical protein